MLANSCGIIINIEMVFGGKSMNKKRFFTFLSVLILIVAAVGILVIRQQNPIESALNIEDSVEGVRFFYYRSIPGLKRAEEADLVVPIHKSYEINEKPRVLKIDRIWYSQKNIYVFYHVENLDKVAYLGGYFYIEEQRPTELMKYDPQESIGRPSERGVLFNNAFYSFATFSVLDNIPDDAVELYFEPYLQIDDGEYSFEPIALDIGQCIKEEPVESYKLEASVQINDNILEFYELEAGISSNKIYFSYTSPNSELIYGLQGNIQTDKGEQFEIYVAPSSILENPGHYFIEIPPFNTIPSSLKFKLKSMDIIGTDSIIAEIETSVVNSDNKGKGNKPLQRELENIRNTTIRLDSIAFDEEFVSLEIVYYPKVESEPPYSWLKMGLLTLEEQKQALYKTQNIYNPLPNIISIKNNFNKSPNESDTYYSRQKTWVYCPIDNKIFIGIPRDFWDSSNKIYIKMNNLTYQAVLEQTIEIESLN